MLFNSFEFLLFFPVVVIGYYVLAHQYRWLWLLLASYYFYFAWEPSLILLLLASTLIDYQCGHWISNAANQQRKKGYLYLSVFVNLGVLCFFKYMGFLTGTTQAIMAFFGVETPMEATQAYQFDRILLPIGISFYTFQTLSYSIDVYRGRIVPIRHLGKYALFVSFFPQLVAGPIERAGRLLPQFEERVSIDIDAIRKGLIMMGWGFFLKLVVADRIGVFVDYVFAYPEGHAGLPLVLGSYFFTFQIYYDFSAYSTIALGAAKVLGFDLMQNFNRPMFFKNMTDFWRRWHVSLMDWLRNYIYRPLARRRSLPTSLIVMLIFFVNGLWHGANWTFVVWGVLCGGYLLLETGVRARLYKFSVQKNWTLVPKIATYLWWGVSVNFLAFSLIFFRSPSVTAAIHYIRQLATIHGAAIVDVLDDSNELLLCFVFLIIIQCIHYYKGNDKIYELITRQHIAVRWLFYVLYIIVLVFFGLHRQNNFIYFQF